MRLSTFKLLFAFAAIVLVCRGARAADAVELAVAEAAAPKELAEEIGAVLQPTVVRLGPKDKPLMEFWFRKEVPLGEKPDKDAFAVTTVKEGTLLGAVRVLKERRDFKDEEIPPGVYVMRLGLQPEDGNHQGTAPTRTFALLTPAAKDRKLESLAKHDDLVKLSQTINAAKHPSNLNLQPVTDASGDFPRLAVHNDGKHKVVYLRLPAKVQGQDAAIDLKLALVYEGKGEI